MATTNPKNSTNVTGIAPDNTVTADTPNAVQKIITAKWMRKIGEDDTEVEIAKIKGKITVSIETENIADDTDIIISLLDAQDDSELSTATLKLKENKGNTDEIEIKDDWCNKNLSISITKENNSNLEETYNGTKKLKISCCEHAIIKGDEGNLIKEINIRLAGFGEFGCPLPQNKFDERTEKAVKQFQRDYMKVTPTGIVCKDFLEKVDKFCEDYCIKIDSDTNFNVKCPCVKITSKSDYHCTTGFGKGRTGEDLTHTHTYNDGLVSQQHTQTYKGTEKPGIHRSLLWAINAMKFYLDKVETSENLKIGKFESSYRCKGDNIVHFATGSYAPKEYHPDPNKTKEKKKPVPRTSNNHMGNAIDIHIYPSNATSGNTLQNADIVRKLFVKYCGALIRWPDENLFCLEPSKKVGGEFTASNWVHIDCREFKNIGNELYCKNETELKGSTFQNLYSSNETDSGKWIKVSDCLYSPTAQTTIPSRIDNIWLGMVNIPDTENETKIVNGKTVTIYKKTLTRVTENNKQLWKTKTSIKGDAPEKKNQCVVEILEENDTEYKIKLKVKGQSQDGWIDKTWVTEVVKFKK